MAGFASQAIRGVGGGVGALTKSLAATAGKEAITAAGTAGLALGTIDVLGKPLTGPANAISGRTHRDRMDAMREMLDPNGFQARLARTRQRMIEMEARFAANDLHTYNEILVGQALAPGDKVYGYDDAESRARIEAVLLQMVQGAYS